jgi:hypothetical protein
MDQSQQVDVAVGSNSGVNVNLSNGQSEPSGSSLSNFDITNISDLLELVNGSVLDTQSWYRGHIDFKWPLLPSVLRETGWQRAENNMLKRFRQEAAGRATPKPEDHWDWLSLAQHHRLPTRLLDWSTNPLVGLFFASERDDSDAGAADGALFVLDPEALNRTSVGADDVLLLGEDSALDAYLPSSGSVVPMGPVAVVAQQYFGRLMAQSGVFTLTHHLDWRKLEEVDEIPIVKWRVPLVNKESIRNELESLNIDSASVYLDLDHFATRIRKRYL